MIWPAEQRWGNLKGVGSNYTEAKDVLLPYVPRSSRKASSRGGTKIDGNRAYLWPPFLRLMLIRKNLLLISSTPYSVGVNSLPLSSYFNPLLPKGSPFDE